KVGFGLGGGGLTIASCSSFSATALRVQDSLSYGVLVDQSDATLGSESEPDLGVDISRNVIGLWVQHIKDTQKTMLMAGQLDGNKGVGIGVSGDTQAFILCKSGVHNTTESVLTVESGGPVTGMKAVGDG